MEQGDLNPSQEASLVANVDRDSPQSISSSTSSLSSDSHSHGSNPRSVGIRTTSPRSPAGDDTGALGTDREGDNFFVNPLNPAEHTSARSDTLQFEGISENLSGAGGTARGDNQHPNVNYPNQPNRGEDSSAVLYNPDRVFSSAYPSDAVGRPLGAGDSSRGGPGSLNQFSPGGNGDLGSPQSANNPPDELPHYDGIRDVDNNSSQSVSSPQSTVSRQSDSDEYNDDSTQEVGNPQDVNNSQGEEETLDNDSPQPAFQTINNLQSVGGTQSDNFPHFSYSIGNDSSQGVPHFHIVASLHGPQSDGGIIDNSAPWSAFQIISRLRIVFGSQGGNDVVRNNNIQVARHFHLRLQGVSGPQEIAIPLNGDGLQGGNEPDNSPQRAFQAASGSQNIDHPQDVNDHQGDDNPENHDNPEDDNGAQNANNSHDNVVNGINGNDDSEEDIDEDNDALQDAGIGQAGGNFEGGNNSGNSPHSGNNSPIGDSTPDSSTTSCSSLSSFEPTENSDDNTDAEDVPPAGASSLETQILSPGPPTLSPQNVPSSEAYSPKSTLEFLDITMDVDGSGELPRCSLDSPEDTMDGGYSDEPPKLTLEVPDSTMEVGDTAASSKLPLNIPVQMEEDKADESARYASHIPEMDTDDADESLKYSTRIPEEEKDDDKNKP